MERTHRIMFVCHGNICRSPMAEFLLKDMIKKEGLADRFVIASSGTSREEIGNPVHQGTRKKLAQDHISAAGKYAVQLTKEDYEKYDAIFLDIEMKKMSGIELSNIIRKKNKTVNLVFVTGEFKYALHGYKVGALQYLMKPIKKEDLFECLDIIKEKIKVTNDSGNYITIELPKRSIKLNCETIEYCIMFSPYIDIYKIGRASCRERV